MIFLSDAYWKRQFDHIEALIKTSYNNIMSALSDFAAQMEEHHGKIEKAVKGIADDIDGLQKKIEELQNGTLTPDDQAILNGIAERAAAIVAKAEALDALVTTEVPEPPATS